MKRRVTTRRPDQPRSKSKSLRAGSKPLGRKRNIRTRGTRRHFPQKTSVKLSLKQKQASNRKKVRASRSGKQFTRKTPAARRARQPATRR